MARRRPGGGIAHMTKEPENTRKSTDDDTSFDNLYGGGSEYF